MILKRLSIISTETITIVMIKQKKSRSIQTQSYHKIIDIEIQLRNKTADNNLEKRKIDAFQKLKRKQTFSWSKIFSFDYIIVCKRKRFKFLNISFSRKRTYLLSFIQNVINEVIEDLHYIRRYYENHLKTIFFKIYRVVVQMFFHFLKKRVDLNETFYIYTFLSSKSLKKYENDLNIVFIFNQSDNCDLFNLIIKIFSFSFSFNFYHRKILIKF